MRDVGDAVKSMRLYVAQVLAPEPRLAELKLVPSIGSPITWTFANQVQGALNLDLQTWWWLMSQDRHAPVTVGSPSAPSSYYLSSQLAIDEATLAANAAADGFTIPLAGTPVDAFAVPNQPQWNVRLWYDRGEVQAPYARVKLVGAVSTSGPSLYYELTQPMAIECYPGAADTADDAMAAAFELMAVLTRGFREGVGLGRPKRVPLFDYTNVDGVTRAATERNPSDFMTVQDFSVRPLENPSDPRMVGVVADVRVSWRKDIDLRTLPGRDGSPVRGVRRVQSVSAEVQGE